MKELTRRDFLKIAGIAAMWCFPTRVPPITLQSRGTGSNRTEERSGLIDVINKEYKIKYNTIAHQFLDMELELGADVHDYLLLDKTIDKAVKRIPRKRNYTKSEAIHALETIDEVLRRQGFTYKENLLLNQGLKTKKIDCDNRSVLYLAIAEVIGLPLSAVWVPKHVFVRCAPADKDEFNWETTSAIERSNSHYVFIYCAPYGDSGESAYLKSLSRQETLSIQYFNTGCAHLDKEDYSGAVE